MRTVKYSSVWRETTQSGNSAMHRRELGPAESIQQCVRHARLCYGFRGKRKKRCNERENMMTSAL